jgi:membrane protease YdiL (CAAX protease family)
MPVARPGRLPPAAVAFAEAAIPAALALLLLGSALARQALGSTALGTVGATFAFGAVLIAAWAGFQFLASPGSVASPRLPADLGIRPRPLSAGIAVAALLLLPGVWLRAHGHPSASETFGTAFFLPLVPALLWIAPIEELFLRGLLQPKLRLVLGAGPAIVIVGLLFAFIHLPAYGWSAIPLDLGVGILLGWLREETGSVAACVAAHTLADLGGWFIA